MAARRSTPQNHIISLYFSSQKKVQMFFDNPEVSQFLSADIREVSSCFSRH